MSSAPAGRPRYPWGVRLGSRLRIGIAIHRAPSLDASFTTVHLALAALRRGHVVRFIERQDFEIDPAGALLARAYVLDAPPSDVDALAALLARADGPRRIIDVEDLDLLLLRVTPYDPAVLAFAGIARDRGVRVINDPDGAALVSSKAWLASQRDVPTPVTLVTRSAGTAAAFHAEQPDGVVVKPARGSGGRAVFRVHPGDPRALVHAFDEARATGDGYVVVQPYLPAAEHGEKRLLWLDGRIVGGYLRHRAPGEFRHNLKRGATAVSAEITDEDRSTVFRLSPRLLATGVRFAGLDVIGGLITEVNALNPGGTVHADRLSGSRLADLVIASLAEDEGTPVAQETIAT